MKKMISIAIVVICIAVVSCNNSNQQIKSHLNKSEENLEWLHSNYSQVQNQFVNKIVAIKDKKIVAAAQTTEELLKNLKNEGINESEVLIEVISPKDEIVIL